jgi:hypothetical protein
MRSTILPGTAMGIAIFALVAQVGLAEDRSGMPAIGESSSPDEHTATSSRPGSHSAKSENPDDMVVGTEKLGSHIAGTENPDGMVAETENLDQHRGRSTALQDLPTVEDQERKIQNETLEEMRERHRTEGRAEEGAGKLAEEAPAAATNRMKGQIAAIHGAKKELEESRERVAKADDVYGKMIQRDYPRGEARLKIVDEQKLAHEALRAAEQRYDAALNAGGSPASH